MKILYFTKEIAPNIEMPNEGSITLGIVGDISDASYPQDGIKRVPALKLIKAMKQMENRDDYCVTGDEKFVDAAKRLGFKAEDIKEEQVETPKEEKVESNDHAKEMEAMKSEHEAKMKAMEDKMIANEKELQRIKKEMKDILLK